MSYAPSGAGQFGQCRSNHDLHPAAMAAASRKCANFPNFMRNVESVTISTVAASSSPVYFQCLTRLRRRPAPVHWQCNATCGFSRPDTRRGWGVGGASGKHPAKSVSVSEWAEEAALSGQLAEAMSEWQGPCSDTKLLDGHRRACRSRLAPGGVIQ